MCTQHILRARYFRLVVFFATPRAATCLKIFFCPLRALLSFWNDAAKRAPVEATFFVTLPFFVWSSAGAVIPHFADAMACCLASSTAARVALSIGTSRPSRRLSRFASAASSRRTFFTETFGAAAARSKASCTALFLSCSLSPACSLLCTRTSRLDFARADLPIASSVRPREGTTGSAAAFGAGDEGKPAKRSLCTADCRAHQSVKIVRPACDNDKTDAFRRVPSPRRGCACDMAALRLMPSWTRTPVRNSSGRRTSSSRPWSDRLASRCRHSRKNACDEHSCRASGKGSAETNPSVFLGSTPVLLFSAAEFGVLSLDLPTRNKVDEAVRDLVLAVTNEETRATAREVSNVFPQVYLCLAALASAWLVFAGSDGKGSQPYATRTRVAIAWTTVSLAGVAVDLTKNLFGRVRPQLGLSSFAFPSGHTCAASVLSGVFLFLLLDPLLATKMSPRDAQGTEPGTAQAKEDNPATAVVEVGTDARTRAVLWFLATSVTACGRVEGNRHWVSDTMGGAALGTVFLSAALLAVGAAEARAAEKKEESST